MYSNFILVKNKVLAITFSGYIIFIPVCFAQNEITDKVLPFNRAVTFGDSLSDNGHFDGKGALLEGLLNTQMTNGRFSNGIVWDEYLFPNQKRGIKSGFFGGWKRDQDFGDQTSNRDINVNYSVGGSTYISTGATIPVIGTSIDSIIPPITDQIGAYINGTKGSKNTFSSKSIITLWAGANDALDAITKKTSLIDKADLVKNKLSDALETLYAAGARSFLIPDMPDFSNTPRFNIASPDIPQQATEVFNGGIAQSIENFKTKHSDATVYAPDMKTLLDIVIRRPDLFGYTNATEACIKIAVCKTAPLGSAIQNQYIFWDEIHPTTRTHAYIANYTQEYWQNPDLAGFFVHSPNGAFTTERNYFFPASERIVEGYLTGNKALYKLNPATLILTGNHSYSGSTFIEEGSLSLGNGGTTGSITGDVQTKLSTRLYFNRADQMIFNGKISGAGDVEQKGSGRTILTSDSDYSGATDISAGEMTITGSIISPVTVNSSATLSGNGHIGALQANDGSFISPGNPSDISAGIAGYSDKNSGTLTIGGNAAFESGSTLNINVTPDKSSSLLDIGGSVSLNGGAVIFNQDHKSTPLTATETLAMLGQSRTFIKSGSKLSGKFNHVAPTYRFIGAELAYLPDRVNVSFAQNNRSFADDAITANQIAVAKAIQSRGYGNRLYDNIAVSKWSDNLSDTYQRLSGDIYASLQTSLLLNSKLTQDTVRQRMAQVFASPPRTPVQALDAPLYGGLWGQAYNTRIRVTDTDYPSNISGKLQNTVSGFITGIDNQLYDNWQFGFLTGYQNTSVMLGNATAAIDSYQLGAYGGTDQYNLQFSFGGSISLHTIETSRPLKFGDINQINHADFKAHTFQTFAELGYPFDMKFAQIKPFAGITYQHLGTNAFTENASPAALSGHATATNALNTILGLRLSRNDALSDTISLSSNAMIGWQTNNQKQPVINMQLAGSNTFSIEGLNIARNALVLQSGLQLNLSQNASIDLSYKGQFANRLKDQSVNAALTIRF